MPVECSSFPSCSAATHGSVTHSNPVDHLDFFINFISNYLPTIEKMTELWGSIRKLWNRGRLLRL